jgi:hypothetical protein
MSDSAQISDLNSTIHLFQGDLTLADSALAIALIERWEHQLQETELFGELSALKQAILDSRTSAISELLSRLGVSVDRTVANLRHSHSGSGELSSRLEQLSQLLSQTSHSLR